MDGARHSKQWVAANYRGRETNVKLADGGSAGRMRRGRWSCCRSLVKHRVCADERQCRLKIIDRQRRVDDGGGGREVANDVVKVSVIVDTFAPAGIDGACPR